MKRILSTLLLAGMTAALTLAGDPASFVRLEVKEYQDAGNPTEVKINLPFTMLSAIAPTIQEAIQDVNLEDHEIDFRAIWQEVKSVGPHQFVEVNGEDEHLTVSTTETHLVIVAVDPDEGEVNVRIPLALGEIIFGQEELLDVDLLLAELENFKGDLLTVEGDKVHVRAWIE